MLVQAALLTTQGIAPRRACRMAVADALSDEPGVHEALVAALDASY
jgi:nitric oxide reductase NorQ protein